MPKDMNSGVDQRVKRVVFPGRFQPVHKGHVQVLRWLLGRAEEVIVVIGSAQRSHEVKNPFTAGERITMLRLALREEGLDLSRVIMIPVPDIEYNSLWVSYLETLLPEFDAAASRNPLVVRLFKERGYIILAPPFFERRVYSGVKIRRLMLEGGEWEPSLPRSVAEYIKSIRGVERLSIVSSSDEIE